MFELFLSQFPDIHSLRWWNAVSTFSTVGFASTAIGVALHDGTHLEYPPSISVASLFD